MNAPRLLLLTLALTFGVVSLTSCASRNRGVILVPEGSVIQIGPKTKGYIRTYVDGSWVLSEGKVAIPDGWYATSLGPGE